MEPGFEVMNLVVEQIFVKFFENLHDGIFTFHGIAEVFKGDTEGLWKVSAKEFSQTIFIALPKIPDEIKVLELGWGTGHFF